MVPHALMMPSPSTELNSSVIKVPAPGPKKPSYMPVPKPTIAASSTERSSGISSWRSRPKSFLRSTSTAITGTATSSYDQEEYVLYGTYEPLSVTITHILNNKSGIDFSSYSHTGLPVAVFAMGAGQELFEGYYDNTDIYFNLAELTGVA